MRALSAVVVSILLISGTATAWVVFRPGYMRIRSALNSTVYGFNDASVTTSWLNWMGTLDLLYWIIPAFLAVMAMIYAWLNAQQKEYVTGGGYR